MRAYDIQIGGDIPIRYTSLVNGKPDPGALRVELDIPVTSFATPFGNPWVRIWGIGIQQISQAQQLTDQPISVYGGMGPGLPLAQAAFNNHQYGLLAKGIIFQPYGNWIGTTQTLDLVLLADGNNVNTLNIVLDWQPGQELGEAINSALNVAIPGAKINSNISKNLITSTRQTAPFTSLQAFGDYIKRASQPIIGGTYPGVDVAYTNGQFYVYDSTFPNGSPDPKAIAFTDLIGQPTWLQYPTIQFTTVMRADLTVGDVISLPPGQYTTSSGASQPRIRSTTAQQGKFQISEVHHVGNSRSPGAGSWVTVFNAYPTGD